MELGWEMVDPLAVTNTHEPFAKWMLNIRGWDGLAGLKARG